MTKLGEKVFQFNYTTGHSFLDFAANWFIFQILTLIVLIFSKGEDFAPVVFGILITPLTIMARRYLKSGVILDNEKGVITLHKWTWSIRKPLKFEEIQTDEIMGVDRDIDVRTETKLVGNTWQTTESRRHNIVLQGKFGTRRFSLANHDDWNLFMTLLYGEEQ